MTTNSYTGSVSNPNGYKSFWDIYNRLYREMWYHYENTTAYSGTPAARLVFEVTPYIGLAYFDNDMADGKFEDVADPFAIPYDFIGSPTQYPNMYPAPTFNEIGYPYGTPIGSGVGTGGTAMGGTVSTVILELN